MTTWTICIATLGQRSDRFQRLLGVLLPQVDEQRGRVNVSALWNNGERPLGEVRQALVEDATGDYVSFIDDDDVVPHYFVPEIITALDQEPVVDYVGFQLQCYVDGTELKPTYHSLRYKQWWDDDSGYYRDVSHLNPVRRELALRVDFRVGEPPEDVSWVDQLRPYVKTERYVDKVMYRYYSSAWDTTWRPGSVTSATRFTRPMIVNSNFSYHPWSAE